MLSRDILRYGGFGDDNAEGFQRLIIIILIIIMMLIMMMIMVLTMMGMPRDCSLCLCEVVAEQLPEEDRVNPSKDFYNMIHVNNFYSLNSSPSLRCVPSARTSPYVPLQKKTQFCDRSRADKQSCIQNLNNPVLSWTKVTYNSSLKSFSLVLALDWIKQGFSKYFHHLSSIHCQVDWENNIICIILYV